MEDKIQLGVIGPHWMRAMMDSCLDMFPSIEPVMRLSDRLEDAVELTRELHGKVDAFMFSGQAPYAEAKTEIAAGIPAFYVPLKGTGLYQALYKLRNDTAFQRLSFDGLVPEYVQTVKEGLNEQFSFSLYEERPVMANVAEMVAFHEREFLNHEGCAAVTSMKLVADQLGEKRIPHVWLTPAKEDVMVTLERLLLATTERRRRESQIVFGRIQIDSYSKLVKDLASEHQVQKRNAHLYRLLLDYIEQLEGYLTAVSTDEYLFITNRGTFEQVTEGYKRMPILEEVKRRLNLRISIGIGFGRSAIEAGTHSRFALSQAQEYGGSACFIVKEDRSVFGPVEASAPIVYPISVTDGKMMERAEQAGMNAAHLGKLVAMVKRKRGNEFTAHELAQVLGITPRSAHRILLQWLDADMISIVGTEKLTSRGRPRQVYQLTFTEE